MPPPRPESSFNNLPMKAAMCCRFKVEDGELGCQRLNVETAGRGRDGESATPMSAFVSVLLPLKAALIIQESL